MTMFYLSITLTGPRALTCVGEKVLRFLLEEAEAVKTPPHNLLHVIISEIRIHLFISIVTCKISLQFQFNAK